MAYFRAIRVFKELMGGLRGFSDQGAASKALKVVFVMQKARKIR